MKFLLSIPTLSLSTHALAFNLALAAAIERKGHTTSTITKTIYHTEVRRLPTNYDSYLGKSGSAISNSLAASSIEGVSEGEHYRVASSISTAYIRPRKPGGEKPTISQISVTGVPIISDTRKVESASSNDASKRDDTLDSKLETVNKRNTNLYNLRADLAPEGYISVYMSNSTASVFCENKVDQDIDDTPKARELHLAVLDATKKVAIPVHGEAVASFCLNFKNAERTDGSKSSEAAGSSEAAASPSKHKTMKVDSETSNTKTRTSHSEKTSDDLKNQKSTKHASTLTTSSDADSITPALAVDTFSKTKARESVSEADGESSETAEYSRISAETNSEDPESSDPKTSTSHSTQTKSETLKVEETEDPSSSTASLKNHGSQATPTDPDVSSIPKATPLALPASAPPDTSTKESLTVSSMNTWYSYINKYLETAEDFTPTAGSTDQTSLQTTDSVNGAAKHGRRTAPTATVKRARAENVPRFADSSMNYTSDYSWMGTASTKQLSGSGVASATTTSVTSTNAAMWRLKPPFQWWRRSNAGRSTGGLDSGMRSSGPDDEPEQEKKEFFEITVEDGGSTRVSTETSGEGEEEVTDATKLAYKQQDNDEDDENTVVKDVDEEEEVTAEEEAEPEKEETGDEDEEPTSTKSKPSKTKTSMDEDDDNTPTTDGSSDANEEPASTEKKPADDGEELTPSPESTDDTPPEDDKDDASPGDDEEKTNDNTSTTSTHKSKSTKSPPSTTSDPDADGDPTPSSQSIKSKSSIPSLVSGVSFAFTPTTPSTPDTTSPLPTPPPPPLPPPPPAGTATIPTMPIIWDPDCPQLSTSTSTAENGVTSPVPMTIGLGCWRTLPSPSSPYSNSSSSFSSSSSSPSLRVTSAFNILSDPQNRQLGVFCWIIIGVIFAQWVCEQCQFLRGEWHVGRGLVWWVLRLEVWGLGRGLEERMEEAEREWERGERQRDRERLAEGTGRAR